MMLEVKEIRRLWLLGARPSARSATHNLVMVAHTVAMDTTGARLNVIRGRGEIAATGTLDELVALAQKGKLRPHDRISGQTAAGPVASIPSQSWQRSCRRRVST